MLLQVDTIDIYMYFLINKLELSESTCRFIDLYSSHSQVTSGLQVFLVLLWYLCISGFNFALSHLLVCRGNNK